jgi:ethanolamine utilization protein EutM
MARADSATGTAIGIIETKGLVPLAVAIEAMVKTANVTCVSVDRIGDGYLAAGIAGGIAPVRHALEAGSEAARAYGEVAAAQIYPKPHPVSQSLIDRISQPQLAAGRQVVLPAKKDD